MRSISSCCGRGAARRLADLDAAGVAARHLEDTAVDQAVDDDHVGALQRLQRLEGQKVGIAGAGADEADPSRRAGHPPEASSMARSIAASAPRMSPARIAARGLADKKARPRTGGAGRCVGSAVAMLGAEALGEAGERARAGPAAAPRSAP